MPKIEQGGDGFFKVDGVPYQRGAYEPVVNKDLSRIGFRRIGTSGLEHDYLIELLPPSEWTDQADSPFTSVQDILTALESFFFRDPLRPLFLSAQRVDTFAELPTPAIDFDGQYWIVDNSTGIPFINRKEKGTYKSQGGLWDFKGADVPAYFVDNVLAFSDDADPTKQLGFTLDDISTGNKRIATWQDKNIIVADELDHWKAEIQSQNGLINQTVVFEPYFIQDVLPNVSSDGIWTLNIPTELNGEEFKITTFGIYSLNSTTGDFLIQLLLNGAPILSFIQEPQDSGGAGIVLPTVENRILTGATANTGTNQRIPFDELIFQSLSDGDTLELQFTASGTNLEAALYSANISVERFRNSNE